MKSIEDKILNKLYRRGKGYAFSSSDFIKEFPINNIEKALSSLAQKGKIRRLTRGIYDYPEYSPFLKKELSPDIRQVADAISRKFNLKIEASGDTALNILGISTQVPGKYIYLSNGPKKTYRILNNISLEFKSSALKNIGFRYKESSLIVQALKSLGKENITDDVKAKIKERIDSKTCSNILEDTKTSDTWIYETIKQICKKELSNG
ncbi:MAG: DUF6088 family protein [bacterium]|jgi:hypothetical protein|uniref:Type IV toxin-antitoxin system AbiEi family antitoxin domain-containing protein n=1 Tax=Candidatus Acididesulfobacter diazotrophicus TaxID=2597226 RepID=A0A519BP06_9DELT|nr:MAG: hypothetical protein EVG15_02550 [Candidatus Acididesulfobacter diazotrophicus]